jgi:ribosomal protein S27E
MTDADGPAGLDPADAFALLGDATRLEIVTALHEAAAEAPVQFSTLYERVDADDTAGFNYHLGELLPHFVAKTDEGYDLTERGRRIARAITAGVYTEAPRFEPFGIDGACYACGEAALVAAYADEQFTVDCEACGEAVLAVGVPPSVVRGRDPADVPAAVDRWSQAQVEQATRGACPTCGGRVEPSVTDDVAETVAFDAVASFDCAVCGRQALTSFGSVASRHPDVRAFYRRRGTSLRGRPYWELPQYVTDDHMTVRSRDPWLVAVTFHAAGDACRVEVDGSLEVVDVEVVEDGAPGDE